MDWDAFYWQQLDRVYNYFRYRVADDRVAEDLVSETFMKALDRWETYNPAKASINTWIMAIARNTCTDFLRTRRAEVPLELVHNHAGGPSVEQIVQRQDDLTQLTEIMNTILNETERDIITLSYGAEMTNREIATLLNLSESNVGTTKQRAVRKVRELWGGSQ